jgi:hypothetical protein
MKSAQTEDQCDSVPWTVRQLNTLAGPDKLGNRGGACRCGFRVKADMEIWQDLALRGRSATGGASHQAGPRGR